MRVEVHVTINAPRALVWAAIADIANGASLMSGVDKIEVLERPANGLVGLRWNETRMLFGKPATAEKWITAAVDDEFYTTRAESDGFVHVATNRITQNDGVTTLTTTHESIPQTFRTRLLAKPMGLLFSGVARKALLQDLDDIRAAVERG